MVARVRLCVFVRVLTRVRVHAGVSFSPSLFFSIYGARTGARGRGTGRVSTSLRACVDAKSACFACKLDPEADGEKKIGSRGCRIQVGQGEKEETKEREADE